MTNINMLKGQEMSQETVTEERILLAAMKVFTKKGFSGARMQEIADEAGINKASLHYYFRSKQLLFDKIFNSVLSTFLGKISELLNTDLGLEEKISQFCNQYISMLQQNPQFPNFILNELQQNPDYIFNLFNKNLMHEKIQKLQVDLDKEIEFGNIRPIKLQHLIANIMSLCIFPFAARPLMQYNFGYDNNEYYQFLEDRKKHIPEFIMNSIKIKK